MIASLDESEAREGAPMLELEDQFQWKVKFSLLLK